MNRFKLLTKAKKYLFLFLILGLFFLVVSIVSNDKVFAWNGSDFNAGRIIDDGVFANSGSMSINDIQNFLNTQVPNCDTNGSQLSNHSNGSGGYYTHAQWGAIYDQNNNTNTGAAPYVCLKSYVENPLNGQNNLQNPNLNVPNGQSSAQIIYNAAKQYTINPQVILVTLQKEQGLITDNWPWTNEYTEAMGFNCPDTGACSGYAGFYQQVTAAAKQFRNYLDNPNSFNYVVGNNNIAYAPGCGVSTVNIQNQATAALYDYTPYQPSSAVLSNTNPTGSNNGPGGAVSGNCNTYGNRNFWWYFDTWFESTYSGTNQYSFISLSASTINFNPGQTGTVSIKIENIGTNTWYADYGTTPSYLVTRLAVAGYRNSSFIVPDRNSLFTQNQILMTPSTVAPGQTATFTFETSAPYSQISDTINFIPVVGGSWLNNQGVQTIMKVYPSSWSLNNISIESQNLLPNEGEQVIFSVTNSSMSNWYSDDNPNHAPTRLATIGYADSPFADPYGNSGWLGTKNQIRMTPSTVAPGQTATFSADFVGPITNNYIVSHFHFSIENGGVFGIDKGTVFDLRSPAAILSYKYLGCVATQPLGLMPPGSRSNVTASILNTGNVVWYDYSSYNGAHDLRLVMNHPLYRNSSFYDSGDHNWLAPSQIGKSQGTTRPGQIATFNFNWLAPVQKSIYHETFQPKIDGVFMQDNGLDYVTMVQ
jgi:hypothetical protein